MFSKFKYLYIACQIVLLLAISGCASYYKTNLKFQENLYSGDLEKADKILEKDKKTPKGKNQLLYYLNRGYINWLLGNYEASNRYFGTADRLVEDYQKNYGYEALALLTNPMIKPYVPEDFESVMLNYFPALNYVKLGKYEDAIVECKRINLRLNKLNDKYSKNKNRYNRDAFAHTVMGLIYEADGQYNDAFIAYRNALEIYETDYTKYFGIGIPDQLKKDILRTAYYTGLDEEVKRYEEKFGIKFNKPEQPEAELVFFWMNGFGPVKDEWSINFTQLPGQGPGWIILADEENGMSFPLYIGDRSDREKAAFSDLRFLRVAFPKYVERRPIYTHASITSDAGCYTLEQMENINEIAFKTLQDRMMREMANSILRLATKKALEALARKENKDMGTLVGIINAITEKADTRNWQTLPYSISYARIPLKTGQNKITLKVNGLRGEVRDYSFDFTAKKGQTLFHYFHSIETIIPPL